MYCSLNSILNNFTILYITHIKKLHNTFDMNVNNRELLELSNKYMELINITYRKVIYIFITLLIIMANLYVIMNYFMFNNNYIMSENVGCLSTKYRIIIYDWRGDPSKIMKRIKYWYLNKLTDEHTIIVSHLAKDLIDMRCDFNYVQN